MSNQTSRRHFLSSSAAAGVGFWVAGGAQAAPSKSPNDQIQVACFGVGGKGDSDSKNASRHGKIVAVCDADKTILERSAKRFKIDAKFTDFRELLDKMGDKIDAVTVSTPDHNHAVIAAKAMKMGKHCYCQKPMTRSVYAARMLEKIAREKGVSTQMGNQYTAYNPMREAAYQIRAGQLGTVSAVHVWTNRPVWPQGGPRKESKPVPAHLDWNVWLGPAPYRPYADGYHSFAWRGWWDFGSGALGDMACHTVNLPFMALTMRDPVSISATSSGHNGDSYPSWSRIKYEFPALDGRAAFTLYWYDGGQLPDQQMFRNVKMAHDKGGNIKPDSSGALIIGDKATMYAAGDYAQKGIEIVGDVDTLKVDYPHSPGHVEEWFIGMRDPSKQPMSNFANYGGPLTETILLGNLAVYKASVPNAEAHVKWDAENMVAVGDPYLSRIVQPPFRAGYTL
jgi:predicted dehydrogenase